MRVVAFGDELRVFGASHYDSIRLEEAVIEPQHQAEVAEMFHLPQLRKPRRTRAVQRSDALAYRRVCERKTSRQ